jgi:hypothetical protein
LRSCHPAGPDHFPASRPLAAPSPTRSSNCCTLTGSTRPSPATPRPEPVVQPILASNLFPTLESSAARTGGGGGGGGWAGWAAAAPAGGWGPLRKVVGSKAGRSGWWCTSRRSAARSRYLGSVDAMAAFLRCFPAAREAGSARLVCIRKDIQDSSSARQVTVFPVGFVLFLVQESVGVVNRGFYCQRSYCQSPFWPEPTRGMVQVNKCYASLVKV